MFTREEQLAMLQCFWQLLSAKPSDADSKLVENVISKDWECKDACAEMTEVDILMLRIQCGIENPLPWILCAVQLSPYDAFETVTGMTTFKKEEFKRMVVRIVDNGGNVQYKAGMAGTLFDKTNVSYRLVPRVYKGIGVRYVFD